MTDASNALQLLMAMQEGPVISRDDAREAILLQKDDLPHVTQPDESTLQLLQVDLNQNMWIVSGSSDRPLAIALRRADLMPKPDA